MTEEITRVWLNPDNGHHYALGPDGATLNGMPTVGRPEWVDGRPADALYGPMKPWGGGECPVPPETPVRAVFRGRRPYIGPAIWPSFPAAAKAAMWRHAPAPGRTDSAADIIGYQIRIA